MTTKDDRSAGVAKVAELMSDSRLCMFTTKGRDGHLLSRPMALQQTDFDGDVWFFAKNDSRKVADVRGDSQVNVSFQSGGAWVSLSGRAEIVLDEAKKKDLWSQGAAAWFDNGPESDEVVLIRVVAEGAEYWSTPGSAVSTLLAYAKARLTGDKPDIGTHDTVDM